MNVLMCQKHIFAKSLCYTVYMYSFIFIQFAKVQPHLIMYCTATKTTIYRNILSIWCFSLSYMFYTSSYIFSTIFFDELWWDICELWLMLLHHCVWEYTQNIQTFKMLTTRLLLICLLRVCVSVVCTSHFTPGFILICKCIQC